jgi:hypothetical protein
MRLHGGAFDVVTTAVAAVASDDGKVYFLDLGRFKAVTPSSTLAGLGATVAAPTPVAVGTAGASRRLWIQDQDDETGVVFAADDAAAAEIGRTPGWTRSAGWTVAYQGVLHPSLAAQPAEARLVGTTRWLALQVPHVTGDGRRVVSEVVRLWHPAFGVRATGAGGDGDIVEIPTATIEGCASAYTTRGIETPPTSLDARVDALLPPTADYPGGALGLGEEPAPAGEAPEATEARAECFAKIGATDTRVTATLRARGLVLTSLALGYAGRPAVGALYRLAYPAASGDDEDDLAGTCPLVDWDGRFPVPPELACDDACRVTCEPAVLARKARRVHNNFEDCAFDPSQQAGCSTLYGHLTLPNADGPALAFRVGVQERGATDAAWSPAPASAAVRGMALALTTQSGADLLSAPATGSLYLASGAIAFDRSLVNAAAGYRFLVSYTADVVLDASPHVNPLDAVVIR